MSVVLAAVLLLAGQSPAPAPTNAPAVQKKPKQICEMMEVTGSRSKKRVCRDAAGNLNLGPGVSSGGNVQVPKSEQANTPGS
jgi:hypothetical protein